MKTESLLKPPTSKVLKSGRVVLKSGEDVEEHVTENKEEIIVVLKGRATVVEDGEEIAVRAGRTHFVRENVKHNVRNDFFDDLEYIYVVALLNS